jgi:RND superfamily putative drug exporter
VTVLLALAGMLLVRSNIFISIGIGAMVVVVWAIVASLTLLPALLGILGHRINWIRVPLLGKAAFGRRFWSSVTHAVQKRPAIFAAGAAALLVAAALPLATADRGGRRHQQPQGAGRDRRSGERSLSAHGHAVAGCDVGPGRSDGADRGHAGRDRHGAGGTGDRQRTA